MIVQSLHLAHATRWVSFKLWSEAAMDPVCTMLRNCLGRETFGALSFCVYLAILCELPELQQLILCGQLQS